MTKFVVMDEVYDIITSGRFENLTAQKMIDIYFKYTETDADIICVFDSEEDALRCLEKLELCAPKELRFNHGLAHIAFVRRFNDGKPGEVIKARVGT